MRRDRLLTAVLALLVPLIASCRDATAPTAKWTAPAGTRYLLGASGTLDGEITTLIAALFPNGLETAAGTRWDGIRDKYAAGDIAGARKRVTELSKWVKSKQSQMDTPPMNESRGTAAARLILYMSLYVYNGPNTPIPTLGAGADAVAQIVTPTEPALVQTELKWASARFDAGSVSDETIVVITQNTQFFKQKCSGPFNTKYCQYPLYYHYQSFPHVRFLKDVHTAICHVHRDPTGPYDPTKYEPLPGVDHDQFVVLHDLPANASDYTTGGLPVPSDNVEVLPRNTTSIPATPPTSCSGSAYGQVALFDVPAAPSGVLGKAYAFAARAINGAATSVSRMLTPESLYAVDNGEEHNTAFFSEFTNADTSGHPDLAVSGSSVSSTTLVVGDPLTLSYTVANIGTAHSPVVNTVIRLTPTGEGGGPSIDLTPTSAPSTAALYPEESRAGSAAVTIPADLAPGTYKISVVVSSAGGLAEIATDNNIQSVAITVSAREVVTVTVPFGAELTAPQSCDGASACGPYFDQDGFRFEAFWFEPGTPAWPPAHFHPATDGTNAYEAHHFQGDLARQGIWIRRTDGAPFSLKSIDYRNAPDASPFEIGTGTITSVGGSPSVAMSASGPYATFPTTTSESFQTLLTPGVSGVTEVFITMRGAANWDNIVLTYSPSVIALR